MNLGVKVVRIPRQYSQGVDEVLSPIVASDALDVWRPCYLLNLVLPVLYLNTFESQML